MIMPLARKTTTSHNHTIANFFTLVGRTMTQTTVNIKTSFVRAPDKKSQIKKCLHEYCHYLVIQKTGIKVGSALSIDFC